MRPSGSALYRKTELIDGLAALLEPHGFKRSGQAIRFKGPDGSAVVTFDTAPSSNIDGVKITVQTGTFYPRLVALRRGHHHLDMPSRLPTRIPGANDMDAWDCVHSPELPRSLFKQGWLELGHSDDISPIVERIGAALEAGMPAFKRSTELAFAIEHEASSSEPSPTYAMGLLLAAGRVAEARAVYAKHPGAHGAARFADQTGLMDDSPPAPGTTARRYVRAYHEMRVRKREHVLPKARALVAAVGGEAELGQWSVSVHSAWRAKKLGVLNEHGLKTWLMRQGHPELPLLSELWEQFGPCRATERDRTVHFAWDIDEDARRVLDLAERLLAEGYDPDVVGIRGRFEFLLVDGQGVPYPFQHIKHCYKPVFDRFISSVDVDLSWRGLTAHLMMPLESQSGEAEALMGRAAKALGIKAIKKVWQM
ncbi:MAG: hypothetical protein AB8H79_16430 [Myxococcota bacterium]